jgi:hypothetical protein
MPRLRRSLYDESELGEAVDRGWRCMEPDADDLAIRTRPERVVMALESLLPRRTDR